MTQLDPIKKCEFCDKRGLPLLLVRDAVAPNDSNAPLSSDAPFVLPAHAAHYTRRLIRNGYINVFDEARKRWEAYYITRDAYFFRMPLKPGVMPIKPDRASACFDLGHRALASCITVSDPTKATKVWIGFSDVMWTEAVRAKNAAPAHRAKHMVAIDVRKVLAGAMQEHCRPVSQVSSVVAEFALAPLKGIRLFNFSPFSFNEREKKADRLISECDLLRPGKGQIVTVPDPAGIAQELAQLMKRNVDYFNRNPARTRMVSADAAIVAIEAGVRDQAALMQKESEAKEAIYQAQNPVRMSGSLSKEDVQRRVAELQDFTPADAKKAADNAWARYTVKFSGQARNQWKLKHARDLAAYDKKWVVPLAISHVDVMKSHKLAQYFDYNFDDRDVNSGAVFTKVVSQCAIGTQDKSPCADLYGEWLEGDFSNNNNLLLRALVFNQKEVGAKLDKASKETVDWRSIPWDNLIPMFAEATSQLAAGTSDVVANALVTFGGPIAKLLGKVLDGKISIGRVAVLVMGVIGGHPVMTVELTLKRIDLRRYVAKELIKRSGLHLDLNKVSQAVGAEMTLQGITGKILQGHTKTTWLLFIEDHFPNIDPTLSDAEKIKVITAQIRTLAQFEDLNMGRFKTVVNTNVRMGVLGALAQYAALRKLMEDEAKASKDDKTEAYVRLGAGILSLSATTADILTGGFKGVTLLRYGSGYVNSGIEGVLKATRALGVAAALVVAGADAYQAIQSYRENDLKMAALYGGAAIAGGTLGVFLAYSPYIPFATLPVIGLLFAVVITLGLLIEIFKDNELQNWLERCCWGELPAQRYKNEATEQAAYRAALKG